MLSILDFVRIEMEFSEERIKEAEDNGDWKAAEYFKGKMSVYTDVLNMIQDGVSCI